MKNQIVASIAALPFALGTVFASAGVANAQVIQFDDVDVNGGTLSYDGEGGALIGTDLGVDLLIGIDTPSNTTNPLSCIECKLNFETGLNISEDPYVFSPGGSITVTGTVKDLNDGNDITIAEGTFLTGVFTENIFGSAVEFGGGMGAATFTGIGFDTKDPAISEYFGIDGIEFNFAQTSIAMGDVNVDANGGFSGIVTNVDLDNIPVDVPEPTVLFALGVVAAGLVSRRQKNY
ncbi:MAG: PEP-CTERM sorting domain-containing protein [Okeania sp. SIO3C4]|nr:PEP-CTERM sorting domain-containing protein [Okeania sp. SIO3C4]